ncbi:MAG: sulfatase [Planctomycetota bacterium]
MSRSLLTALTLLTGCYGTLHAGNEPRPKNVLMLIVDDLNTWLLTDPNRYTGKVVAPNIQRLAKQGVLFHNAYAASPVCVPSRTAFLSGVAPWKSGVYINQVSVMTSPAIQRVPSLFKTLRERGYSLSQIGKVSHGYKLGVDVDFRLGHKRTPPPPGAPLNGIAKAKSGKVTERDWGATHLDEDEMSDKRLADAAIEQIRRKHDKPFFIACGLFHPHYPWYVPQKYLDLYPLDEIELPPIQKKDLDDTSPAARGIVNVGWDDKIQEHGLAKKAIQGYLASVSFSDVHMGRILQALDESPHRDDTIVLLLSDHGFHLGEKQNWTKATPWEEATDSVLMFRVPGVTKPEQVCTQSVSLLDIYPTLMDLTGTTKPSHLDGKSLVPQLRDVNAPRPGPAIMGYAGHLAVRTKDFRFIRYLDGSTELYDRRVDPNEWKNETANPKYTKIRAELNALLPPANDVVPPLPRRVKEKKTPRKKRGKKGRKDQRTRPPEGQEKKLKRRSATKSPHGPKS